MMRSPSPLCLALSHVLFFFFFDMANDDAERGPELPCWWLGVQKTFVEPRMSRSFLQSGKEEPLMALAVSTPLLLHMRESEMDMVRHVNFALKRRNVPLRLSSNSRVADALLLSATKAASALKKAKGGRERHAVSLSTRKIHLWPTDVCSPHEMAETLEEYKENMDALTETAEALLADLREELLHQEEKIEHLQNMNKELSMFVDELVQGKHFDGGHKTLGESGRSAAYTKLRELKGRAQVALLFANVLGVDVRALVLADQRTGQQSFLELDDHHKTGLAHGVSLPSASQLYAVNTQEAAPEPQEGTRPEAVRLASLLVQAPEDKPRPLSSFSDEEKDRLYELMHILDRFSVSDDAYHELTMHSAGKVLPRSYIIKQARQDLNNLQAIELINEGGVQGARLSFTDAVKEEIRVFKKEEKSALPEKIKLKVAGDGATMSRTSTFQLLNVSVLNRGRDVLGQSGVKTVAVFRGEESYKGLKDGFADVWQEINSLIEEKRIEVDGAMVAVDTFLGGDMKFQQKVLGLKGATATYACVRCKVAKEERWNMDKSDDTYVTHPMARTIEELTAGSKEYGQLQKPLIIIPLDRVIVDELHLLLRVTDVLERNIVLECHQRDVKEGHRQVGSGRHVRALLDSMRQIGVSFQVWTSKQPGKEFDCTSLMGPDKKKVLRQLPSFFSDLLLPETAGQIAWLWKEFHQLYLFLSNWLPSSADYAQFQQRSKEWVRRFCSIGQFRLGYQRADVTPYIHTLPFHVPHLLKKHGPLKPFSCQAIEKRNDLARRTFHRKSNRKDACSDVLLASERCLLLGPFSRTTRSYHSTQRASCAEDAATTEPYRLTVCEEWEPLPQRPSELPQPSASTSSEIVATSTTTGRHSSLGGESSLHTPEAVTSAQSVQSQLQAQCRKRQQGASERVTSKEEVLLLSRVEVSAQLRRRGLAVPKRPLQELRARLLRSIDKEDVGN